VTLIINIVYGYLNDYCLLDYAFIVKQSAYDERDFTATLLTT